MVLPQKGGKLQIKGENIHKFLQTDKISLGKCGRRVPFAVHFLLCRLVYRLLLSKHRLIQSSDTSVPPEVSNKIEVQPFKREVLERRGCRGLFDLMRS